jgi:hypothetical protein
LYLRWLACHCREICKAFEHFGESFGNYEKRFGCPKNPHSDHVEDENLDDLISKDPKALERYLPSSSQDTHESFEGFKPDDRTRSESVVIRTYPDGVSGNNRV